jgi:hypothetical protein
LFLLFLCARVVVLHKKNKREDSLIFIVFVPKNFGVSSFSHLFRSRHFVYASPSNFQKTTKSSTRKHNTRENKNHHQIMQGARQSDVFFGERESGQDVRQSNVTAVQAVANIVKSSLGPVGLDKV